MIATLALLIAAAFLWPPRGSSEQRLSSLRKPTTPTRTRLKRNQLWTTTLTRIRRARAEATGRQSVIELCDALAAELTAGRTPEDALARAVSTLPAPLSTTLTHIPTAPDIPIELDKASTSPGAQSLRLLAACWRIGVERGATFATVTDGLSTALRDEAAHQEHVTSQLAAPRATAKLLAALPLAGITMAWALGADPLSFLFTTLPGLSALTLGLLLNATGLLWTHRIAHQAEHPT